MPNLSADSGAIPTQTGGIGWLKFVVEKDCQGIKAALFRTSEQTEPRNFCFARVDCSGIRGSAAARYRSALRNVAVSLLRNTYVRPQLLIGLADEIPPGLFSDSFGLDIPFCRIRQASTIGLNENGLSASGFNGHQLLWETERPSGGSEVQRLLRSVQERTESFEPFQRAAAGVKEAFDDMFVQSMTAFTRFNYRDLSVCSRRIAGRADRFKNAKQFIGRSVARSLGSANGGIWGIPADVGWRTDAIPTGGRPSSSK